MSWNKTTGFERPAAVRTSCDHGLGGLGLGLGMMVGVLLGSGCTEGGAVPDSVVLAEVAPSFQEHAGFTHQPERARVVDPATQPRLELVLGPVPLYDDPLGDAVCPFVVKPRQFPAISEDGATLVEAYPVINGNADMSEERMELTWLDADETQLDEVYDRSGDNVEDQSWTGCDGSIEHVRERVAAINAKLEQRVWRPLEPLDAFYSQPGFAEGFEFTGNEDAAVTTLAGDDRPIEVYYRNDELIARVRGMQVLQRTAGLGWPRSDNDFCNPWPQIDAIEFDRASAVALVRYNYINGGCLCDDAEYLGRVELSAELMAAIDSRSTAAFKAARRALDQADELERNPD